MTPNTTIRAWISGICVIRRRPQTASSARPNTAEPTVGDDGHNDAVDLDQNTAVDLGRIAWLGTVLVCLVVVLILVLQGYYGYAAVTFAVALAAGINLL